MKRDYKSPKMEIVSAEIEGVCEWIHQSGPSDDVAKQNNDDVVPDDEPDLAAPIKDKWEDLSEKKIAK